MCLLPLAVQGCRRCDRRRPRLVHREGHPVQGGRLLHAAASARRGEADGRCRVEDEVRVVPQPKPCRDCVAEGITTMRPTPYAGPRCSTHHRQRRKAVSSRQHANRIQRTYQLSPEDYQRLYEAQGGCCAICRKATGKTKRLAVDHNHRAGCGHDPNVGCPSCIRGLLCATCNTIVVGRYDILALGRAISYIFDPPARKVLRNETP